MTLLARFLSPWRLRATLGGTATGYLLAAALCFAVPGVAAAQSQDTASTAVVEDSLNIWEKRLVQEGLILLGFYNGFADGVFGNGTHAAIAAFQTKHDRPGTGQVTATDALDLAATAMALQKKLDWRHLETATGIAMSYPAALLSESAKNKFNGETLTSHDGHISLMTVVFPDSRPDGIDGLFTSLSNGETVTYKFRRPGLFILSGDRQGGKFYSRMEQRGSEIRGYDLTWNADSDDLMSRVSVLISNGFYPFGNAVDEGQPTYPLLSRLADKASPDAPRPADQGPPAETPSQSGTSETSDKDGVVEHQPDALPPPKDGALVTSDGKGLRFTYQYLPPDNQDFHYAYQWAVDTHLFSTIPEIDGLDGMLVIPRPLRYVTVQCGAVNAFYSKKLSAVVLCYEMIDSLTKMGAAVAKGSSDPKALTVEFVKDNLRFILLHESGHAMIDLLDIPAVGREEDSVDQLAAVLLMTHTDTHENENAVARVIQLAATWFKVNSADTPNNDKAVFADEHELDAQRYYNLLCFVYGRDPDYFKSIVANGLLPKARADRCPDEAAKITRSWSRLLLPHFAPRFKPHDQSGGDAGNNAPPPVVTPARNPLEWDGKTNPFDH